MFPQSPPLTSQQVVRLGSASCDVPEAHTVIDNAIHDFLQDKIEHILPCTPEMTGLVAHCPANNCSEIFD